MTRIIDHLSLFFTGLSYAAFHQHEGRAFLYPRHGHVPSKTATTATHHRRRLQARVWLSASDASNESSIETRTTHEIIIELPLGIILEEITIDSSSSEEDADPSGVVIIGIQESGNAAIYNSNIFSKLKSFPNNGNIINCRNDCICIRDQIMSINGQPCHDKSLDDVIALISHASDGSSINNKITMGLGRLEKSTIVNYHHGIAISAKPGESYGFLAAKCGIDTIQYKCRSGNCQTCMRWMEFPDKIINYAKEEISEEVIKVKGNDVHRRTILHCVGKVPRGYEWLHVLK